LASGWWSAKVRRTWHYLRPSVSAADRAELAGWLTPQQLCLYDAQPAGDRRHGLDVVASLRSAGTVDPDLLVAGLLHDCGKGRHVRFPHRVVWSLSMRYGTWIARFFRPLPTFETGLAGLRDHATRSAELAAEAGCGPRTVELIRNHEAPTDDAGRLLLAADEAN
jgi:hypothetical protein